MKLHRQTLRKRGVNDLVVSSPHRSAIKSIKHACDVVAIGAEVGTNARIEVCADVRRLASYIGAGWVDRELFRVPFIQLDMH